TLLANPTPTPSPIEVPLPEVEPVKAGFRPDKWGVALIYSPLDMWVPSKFGGNITYNDSDKYSYELEYLKGSIGSSSFSIDIGKISDTRVSLLQRSFNNRRSFNYFWGAYYEKFEVRLG